MGEKAEPLLAGKCEYQLECVRGCGIVENCHFTIIIVKIGIGKNINGCQVSGSNFLVEHDICVASSHRLPIGCKGKMATTELLSQTYLNMSDQNSHPQQGTARTVVPHM